MKKLRILREILRRTHANKILLGFVSFWFLVALLIMIVEPGIHNYADALWYCYIALATIGFGDFVAVTFIGRTLTVVLTFYATLVVAIITGVVVNYYMQIIQLRQKETLSHLMDRLEQLPEMTTEELQEISDKVKHFRNS